MAVEPQPPLDVRSRVREERRMPVRRPRPRTAVVWFFVAAVVAAGATVVLVQPFGGEAPPTRGAPSAVPNRSPVTGDASASISIPIGSAVPAPGIRFSPIQGLDGAAEDPVFGGGAGSAPVASASQIITVQVPCVDPEPGCPAREVAAFKPSMPQARRLSVPLLLVGVVATTVAPPRRRRQAVRGDCDATSADS